MAATRLAVAVFKRVYCISVQTSSVDRVAGQVAGSRCMNGSFQSVSESISLQLNEKLKHSMVLWLQTTYTFSQVMSPSTTSMNRRNTLMRNGQATPNPLGGNLSRSMMSNSLPAIPILSDDFYDTNHKSDDCASGICKQEGTHCRRTDGPEECENVTLRMKSPEPSFRNRISEHVARSELKPLERDPRYALFFQDQQLKIAVRKYQRQARDAVNQAVKESSEHCEVKRMREFQGIQNRKEGRMDENERRVAQMIGSDARDALRGQRSRMLHEHQVLLQATEKENRVREKPDALGATVTQCYRRSLHEREVQQERSTQNRKFQEARLKVQLQTEELMMTSL